MSNHDGVTGNGRSKSTPKVLAWRSNARGRTNTNWGDVDPELIRQTIRVVTAGGGSIMFGVTSDGGAFSVLVLHGDQKLRDYPHGIGECEESLKSLQDAFEDFP